MLRRYLYRNLADIILLCSSVIVLGSLFGAKSAVELSEREFDRIGSRPVKVPAKHPEISQNSIDRAIELFSIKMPKGVEWPLLDLSIQDRGVTILDGYSGEMRVLIGPGAFSSWAILGSTLSHELEVHCRQNFGLVRFLDFIGFDGTTMAEREAYQHEIEHAIRFGLTRSEISGIQDTMDFFYPLDKQGDSLSAKISHRVNGLFVE